MTTTHEGTGGGRRLALQLTVAFYTFVFIGAIDGAGGVLLPSYQAQYHLDKSSVSALFFCGTIGYLSGALASGMLRERLGTRAFLTLGGVCYLGGMGLLQSVPAWGLVLLAAGVNGVGGAIVDAGLNAYVAAMPDNSARLNYLHAFYGAGALIGPLLAAGILAAGLHWSRVPAVLWVGALVLTASLLWGFARPIEATAGVGQAGAATGNVLLAALRLPLVWIGAVFLLCYVGTEVIIGSWSFSYLTEQRGLATLPAGWLVSGYWLGLTLGRLVLGRVVLRFGNIRTIQACLLGTMAGLALLWLGPGPATAAAGLLLAGFSLGPIFPTMIAEVSNRVTPRLVQSAVGFMASLGAGGAAFFPWVAGNLAQRLGLWAVLPTAIGTALMVLLLWLLFQWRLARPVTGMALVPDP